MTAPAWVVATVLTALASSIQAQIHDPIPADPVMARLGLVVKEIASFPKSQPVPEPIDPRLMRRARINYLGEGVGVCTT
jgi:hypothetical protein